MRHKTQVKTLNQETLFFDTSELEDSMMQLDDFEEEEGQERSKSSDAQHAQARRTIENLLEAKRIHKELDYLEDFDYDEFDDLLGDDND